LTVIIYREVASASAANPEIGGTKGQQHFFQRVLNLSGALKSSLLTRILLHFKAL